MLSTDSNVSLVYSPAISSGIELPCDLILLESSVPISLSHPPPLGTSSGTELSLLLRPNTARSGLLPMVTLLPEWSAVLVNDELARSSTDSLEFKLLLEDKDLSVEKEIQISTLRS